MAVLSGTVITSCFIISMLLFRPNIAKFNTIHIDLTEIQTDLSGIGEDISHMSADVKNILFRIEENTEHIQPN